RSREPSIRLARQLHAAGMVWEGAALCRAADHGPHAFILDGAAGPWAGRNCWAGPHPREPHAAGEVWLDTVEMMPMIVTPDEQPDPNESYSPEALASFRPYHGWMAMRATAVWQFAAFLNIAPFGRRTLQLDPPIRTFD